MKIGLISLGCPKNLVDSEVMLGLARDAGHELTHDAAAADVLVVNTCAFIDSAKQESIDTILDMARHKTEGTCQRLVVTGCLAERYRDALKAEIPEIDAVLGTGEVPDIIKAIGGSRGTVASALPFYRGLPGRAAGAPETILPQGPRTPPNGPTYLYDADTPRLLATPKHYAYIKVAEGCDYTCAFCIIPTLRGPYRSRSADSIVKEARQLAARGVREVLLISQDTTFYGIDRGERGALGRLLRTLNTVEGIAWIRLLYLYPTTIDDGTLQAMTECDRVCKYIDLPLQHASDAVLKRMRRPGSRDGYRRLLDRIRHTVPGVSLRTTFIVGFPGETDTDVAALEAFVDEQRFDHLGVFTYSHEEGTRAFAFDDDVPKKEKEARRRRIMGRQKQLVRERLKGHIGSEVRVLVDGPSSDHDLVWKGRLECQAPDIDAAVYFTEADPSALRPGQFVDAIVVGSKDYDLVVKPLAG
ncbi:MAG: 30S ribosomal protein S12 methylthiotransferase RimO [Acidimicrobiia bacterium]|nr:30S ribosomal protein S12 methylthiotransferase RimO [Acidimicrobiia bacterium]